MKREVCLGFVGLFCVSRMEDPLIELLEVTSMFELSKYLNGVLFLRNNKKIMQYGQYNLIRWKLMFIDLLTLKTYSLTV